MRIFDTEFERSQERNGKSKILKKQGQEVATSDFDGHKKDYYLATTE